MNRFKVLCVLVLMLGAAGTAKAAVATYNGAADSDYSVLGNWDIGSVPGGGNNNEPWIGNNNTKSTVYNTSGNFTTINRFVIGISASGNGTLTLSGSAGVLTFGGGLWGDSDYIGVDGGKGSVFLNAGTITLTPVAATLRIGANGTGAAGTLTIGGGTLNANDIILARGASGAAVAGTLSFTSGTVNARNIYVSYNGAAATGDASGTGGTASFAMSGGTLNANWIGIGSATAAGAPLATFSLSGSGVITSTNDCLIGFNSPGIGTQSGGAINVLSAGTFFVGALATGTYTISGGSITIAAGSPNKLQLGNGAGGTGIFNLNGGTVTTPGVTKGTTPGTFNFNGGTLVANVANASFMTGLTAANVLSGGAVINDGGYAITIGQALLAGTPSGGLTKFGVGTLTLGGANTYTGGTLLNTGWLAVNNATALGATGSTITFNGGTLQVAAATLTLGNSTIILNTGIGAVVDTLANNLTLSGSMSGAGSLTKVGSGVFYVAGVNSYSGPTAINAGYFDLVNAGALGNSSTINVASGASLQLEHATGITVANTGTISITGTGVGGTRGAIASWSGNNILNSPINMLGNSLVYVQANTATFNGVISETGGARALTKDGAGTLTLTGASANTYTGSTTLTGSGCMVLSKSAGVVAIPGNIVMGGTTPTMWMTANGQLGGSGTLSFTASGNARFDLYGTSQTVAGIIDATGRGVIQNSEAVNGAPTTTNPGTLTIGGSGNYTFNGYVRSSTGTLGLIMNGTGTQTLSGGNINYGGATTINNGRLVFAITGDNTTPSVTISTGATMEVNPTGTHLFYNVNYAGGGTLLKTGSSIFAMDYDNTSTGDNTTSFSSGALIDIQGGTIRLDYAGGNWTANKANLNIANGATLDAWDNSSGVYVNSLNGGGTVIRGLAYNNCAAGTLIVGADNGSGTFSGVLKNGTGSAPGILSFTKTGTGTQVLSGANTLTGTTTVNNGVLQAGAANTFSSGSTLTVGGSGAGVIAVLDLAGYNNSAAGLTLGGSTTTSGGSVTTGSGTLTLGGNVTFDSTSNPLGGVVSGNLNLGGVTRTFTIGDSSSAANDLTVSAVIGNGGLTKAGTGLLLLTANNTFTGPTTVSAGTLKVNAAGTSLAGDVAVSSGGTLGGTGAVAGVVTVASGGKLSVGNSIGTQTFGGLTLSGGSLLDTEFDLANAQTNDQLVVTGSGSLTINGGAFNVYSNGTTGAWGTPGTYNLIQYSGAIGGVGVSALLVNNASPTASYAFGADGGWVTMTVSGASLWDGGGADGNWQTAANWNPDGTPVPPSALTFAGSTRLTATNDFTNATFSGLTFASAAGAFALAGNSLTLSGSVNNNSATAETINLPLVLGAGGGVFNAASGNITLGGVVSGAATLIKAGTGSLSLTGVNTFDGGMVLSAGVLELGGAGQLGSGTYASAITNSSTLLVNSTSAQTLAGVISGSGALTKSNTGTLTLKGANTYGGTTTLSGGSLILSGGDNRLPTVTTLAITGASTFDVGSTAQTIANLTLSATGTLIGTGTLTVNGSALSWTGYTLDASALNGLVYANAAGSVTTYNQVTWKFATNSAVTAASMYIGSSGGYVNQTSTIQLGQDSIINIDTVGVLNSASTGTININFASGLVGPSLVIRGAAGGNSRADWTLANVDSGNNAYGNVTMDLATGVTTSSLDARFGTLTIGKQGWSPAQNRISNGTLSFSTGTLDATTIVVGRAYSTGGGGGGRGTLNINGGTVIVGTLTLAQAESGNASQGTVNINNGGTINAQTIQAGVNSSTTRGINWNDGTIRNYDASTDLAISGLTALTLAATGSHTFNIDSSRQGTVSSVISGSGTLTKAGSGTLTLNSINTYTGATTINAGTLKLGAAGSISNSPVITVGEAAMFDVSAKSFAVSNQVLQGTGAVTGNVTVVAAAYSTVAPGTLATPTTVGTAGTLTITNAYSPDALATNAFDLTSQPVVGGGTNDLLVVNGDLTLNNSKFVINELSSLMGDTNYVLITYTGIRAGTGTLLTTGAGRKTYSLTYDDGNKQVLLTVTGGSVDLTWNPLVSTNWNFADANWTNLAGTAQTAFSNADSVAFTDLGGVSNIVNLTVTNLPGALTVNSANNYVFGGVGRISGNTLLFKSGTGTLTITTTNDYLGATTISEGTLMLGGAGRLGNGAYAAAITNNAALVLGMSSAQTLSGIISGSGSLSQSGLGTLTLTGPSTYSGGTWLGASTLVIASDGAVGAIPGSAVTNITFSGGGTLQAAGSFALNANRAIQINGGVTATLDTQANTLTFGGVVAGAGSLTKAGAGTLILAGANTYAGGTTVSAGVLRLGAANVIPDGAGFGNVSDTGTLDLNTFSETINGLSGAGTVDTVAGGTPTLTVGNADATTTFSGIIKNTAGSLALVKAGAGTLTLAGLNTYVGGTTVNGGVLSLTTGASAGAIINSLTINAAGEVQNNLVNWGLGYTSGTCVTNITINGGTLNFVQGGLGAGTSARTINMTGGTIKGLTYDWYNGITTTPVLNTFPSGISSVISSGFNLRLTASGTLTINVAQGSVPGGPDLLISGVIRNDNGGNAGGNIVKTGAGTLTLSGVNNLFSGTTTISNGVLQVGNSGALQGSTLNYNNQGGTLSFGTQTTATFGGLSGAQNLVLSNDAAVAVALLVGNNNATTIYTGALSGSGSLTKIGSGNLTLGGAASNTYTGMTTLNWTSGTGQLILSKTGGAVAIPGDINMSATGTRSVLSSTVDNQFGAASVMRFTVSAGDTRFELQGTTQTLAGLDSTGFAGTYAAIQHHEVGAPTAVDGLSTLILNVAGGNSYTFGNAAGTAVIRNQGGTVELTKTGAGTQTLYGAGITYTGATTISGGVLSLQQTTGFNSPVTLSNNSTIDVNATAAWTVPSLLSFAGTGTLIKRGTGTLTLGGNDYSTTMSLASGSLIDIQAGAIKLDYGYNKSTWSSNLADMNIASGASFDIWDYSSTGFVKVDALTGSGTVTRGIASANSGLLVGVDNGSGIFSGVIQNGSGTTAFMKYGTGTQTLNGANTYTGATTISNGWLVVNGSLAAGSAVAVVNGATLGGTGNVAGVVSVQNGGHVAPGNIIGSLTNGGLTLVSGSVLDLEFDSANALTNDQVVVTGSGSLTLNGGVVNLYSNGTAGAWSTPGTYNLVKFAGALAGTGTTALTVGNPVAGKVYTFGQSGGWVTLTIGAEKTWNGAAAGDGNWQTGANWSGTAPSAGDALVFGATGAGNVNNTNDFAASTRFSGITFANDQVYVLNGADITLVSNIVNTTANSQTLNLRVALDGSRTFDTGAGNLTINGAITNVNGTWGITKAGAGTLTLTGTNTYAGATTVNAGMLTVSGGNAIGDSSVVTLANVAGAGLTLSGNETVLSLAGGGALGGDIVLNSFILTNGTSSVTTFSGVLSGSGTLTKIGTGTLVFGGTTANTLTGPTVVNGGATGALVLSKAAGVVAVPGDILLTGNAPTLWMTADGQLGGSGILTINGSGNARFDVFGTSQTLAGINDATGRGVVQNSEAINGAPSTTVGGTLTLNGAGSYSFYGYLRNATGTLTVNMNGTGTQTINRNGDRLRFGGSYGEDVAVMNVNSGTVIVPNTYIVFGDNGGTAASLTITGGTVSHTGTGGLYIPNGTGVPATLTVNAGGSYIDAGPLYTQANTGTITINGGLVSFASVVSFGNAGTGMGVLNLNSGTFTALGGGTSYFGNSGTMVWTQSGGVASLAGQINMAQAGNPSTMTVSGGTFTQTASIFFLGVGSGQATMTITSPGFVGVPQLQLANSAGVKGILNLNGGTLRIGTGGVTIGATPGTGVGTISFNGGTFQAGGNMSVVYHATAVVTPVNAGGAIFDTQAYTLSFNNALTGSGGLTKVGSGTLVLAGANTYGGGTTNNAGVLQIGAAGVAGVLPGDATNVASIVYNRSDSVTYANVISGDGSLTQAGSGTLTLTGQNTFTGGATASGGLLQVNTATGNGLVNNAVTVAAGGRLGVGPAVATQTFSGLTLAAGSALDVEFDVGINDKIVTSGNGALTINGGAVNLYTNGTVGTWSTPGTYNLIQYSGSIGGLGPTALSVNNMAPGASYQFATSGGWVTLTIGSATVWDGGGANGNWQTAANWNPDLAPVPPAALAFAGSTRTTNTNDFTNATFGGILFNSGASAFTLRGNSLTLSGGVNNNSAQPQSLNMPLVLGDGGGLFGATSANITLGGVVSGAQPLVKAGANTLSLSGTNTYTGDLTIGAGVLELAAPGQLGSGVYPGAISAVGNLLINSTANQTLSGVISGSGALVKSNTGTLTLTGSNTYASATTLSAGKLILSGGDNRLPTGTTLAITGASTFDVGETAQTIANLTLGATGTLVGGGTLTVNGSALLWQGVTLDASGLSNFVYNNVAGSLTTRDQVTWRFATTNTITASSVSLGAQSSAYVNCNESIVMGQVAVFNVDTVNLLPTYPQGGSTINMNFAAGLTAPTLTIRGSSGGSSRANWYVLNIDSGHSADGNVNLNLTTGVTGSVLDARLGTLQIGAHGLCNQGRTSTAIMTFGAGTLDATTITLGYSHSTNPTARGTLDVTGGTVKVGTMTFASNGGGNAMGTFTISGGATVYAQTMQGGGGSVRVINWNDATIRNYDASTDLTIASGALTAFTLAATGTHAFNIDSSRQGTVSSVISGGGTLTKAGAGTLTLSAINTFTGGLVISNGVVAANGTSVADTCPVVLANVAGAALTLSGSETIASLAGGGTTGGDVSLGANTLTLAGNASTTFGGIISGTGALIKQGSGTLTLTGANLYSGATTVSGGLLVNGSLAAGTAVSIGSGVTLGGTGTVSRAVTVASGGILSPGDPAIAGGVGTLTTGAAVLPTGATLAVQLTTTMCDKLATTSLDVSDATLSVTASAGVTDGTVYVIATGAITGEFHGLPNNAVFMVGTGAFQINYTGTQITLTCLTSGNGTVFKIR